jgi:hypothetical protein
MAGTVITGVRGAYKTEISRTRLAGPTGSGDLGRTLVGNNAVDGAGGSGKTSPWFYFPDTPYGLADNFVHSLDEKALPRYNTTDGVAEWFATLTNSGVLRNDSAQAGYEGLAKSVTGAASGNQNALIATPGFLSVANHIAVCYTRMYLPNPNAAAYDFYFGFGNKQADPAGTPFTDGAWIQGVTGSGKIDFVGKTNDNTGAATTATLGTIASGTARSVELAVVLIGQTRAEFWTRDPSAAANNWVKINATTKLPRNSVILRPHLAIYTRTAATLTSHHAAPQFWWEKPVTF